MTASQIDTRVRLRFGAAVVFAMLFFIAIRTDRAECQNQVVQGAPSTSAGAESNKETYRLRVENMLYGRVEISLDGGSKYTLLGRVSHPAGLPAPDKTAQQAGTVLRSSSEGFAFAITPGFVLKVRPTQSSLPRGTQRFGIGEIITNLSSDRGIFAKLAPPPGSRAMLQFASHSPGTFPESYSVSSTDAFVIVAELPTPATTAGSAAQTETDRITLLKHSVRAQFESIAADYREGAIVRAVADKRKVVAGTLTLRPNLPPDEPDPITAVTYAIDEDVVCARTTAPYLFPWDTTSVSDEEHVVEVRGLGSSGNVITRTRYLVVINNHKATAQ